MNATATKTPVTEIDRLTRQDIRHAVHLAVQHWTNGHLGDCTPSQDIKSAFRIIRSWFPRVGLQPAIWRVEMSAYRHASM